MSKTLVAVYALDWAGYAEQLERKYPFDVIRGWVFGELLTEDDEKIVIAHQSFDDNGVRHVSVIPAGNVLKRHEFTLEVDE